MKIDDLVQQLEERVAKDDRFGKLQTQIDEIHQQLSPIRVEYSGPRAKDWRFGPAYKDYVHTFYNGEMGVTNIDWLYDKWQLDMAHYEQHPSLKLRRQFRKDYNLKKMLVDFIKKNGLEKISGLINKEATLVFKQTLVKQSLLMDLMVENSKNPEFVELMQQILSGEVKLTRIPESLTAGQTDKEDSDAALVERELYEERNHLSSAKNTTEYAEEMADRTKQLHEKIDKSIDYESESEM